MSIFKKQSKELKEKIKEYKERFIEYIKSCANDDDKLNALFTEFTLFRVKHDGKDSVFKNVLDLLKRQKSITRSDWIIVQLEDIMDNFTDKDSAYDREFNDLMNKFLPKTEKQISGWETFWNWICSCFNNAAGKK